MNSSEILEIFDSRLRIKLSLSALLSVCLLACYALFGSKAVASQSELVDNLIIVTLSLLCLVTIYFYIQQLRDLSKATKWLKKNVPQRFESYRVFVAESDANARHCEANFSSDFHHSLIEAKTLLLKAKKIVSELRFREKRISQFINSNNVRSLLSAHILMNSVIGKKQTSHEALSSNVEIDPIEADKVQEQLEDIFLSIQTKTGIAKDATKRAADSIIKQQALSEQELKSMKSLSLENKNDSGFDKKREEILKALRKKL